MLGSHNSIGMCRLYMVLARKGKSSPKLGCRTIGKLKDTKQNFSVSRRYDVRPRFVLPSIKGSTSSSVQLDYQGII